MDWKLLLFCETLEACASSMSDSGLEEKVKNMNVDEKEAVVKKKDKDSQKMKKKDEHSTFPLEVVSFRSHVVVRCSPS